MSNPALRDAVQKRYGSIADSVSKDTAATCCAESCCDSITSGLYANGETADLPPLAVTASLGCGHPTALAEINPGETVLDLGSGGGIDVLLSARRVGEQGKVYGLDMTDEMLALARENQRHAGATNVEFLKGHIEAIPLPDNSVDLVISNCVINLSDDKDAVLAEAFRVLRPHGRLAIADVVALSPVPADTRLDMERRLGCTAGALEEDEYRQKLKTAGFRDIDIERWRTYGNDQPSDGQFASAFIRAQKPGQRTCCDSSCCA